MPLSMTKASLPVFEIVLNAARRHARQSRSLRHRQEDRPLGAAQFAACPDMFALARQVQVTCDHAKNGAARLAGIEPVKFEDNETTIAQLKERIAKTLALLKTLDAKAIDGADRPRDRVSARASQGADARRRLSQPFRAAELLFPRHGGLRRSAPLRCRVGQARFPRRHSAQAALVLRCLPVQGEATESRAAGFSLAASAAASKRRRASAIAARLPRAHSPSSLTGSSSERPSLVSS